VYEYDGENMELKYILDFNNRYMPDKLFCKHSEYMASCQKFATMQEVFIEGDNSIYYLILDDAKYKHGIYYKHQKKNILLEGIKSDKDVFRIPEFYHDGCFYSFVEPTLIIDNKEHFGNIHEVHTINENDNPVLIKFKIQDVLQN
jgi:hypothetical protein